MKKSLARLSALLLSPIVALHAAEFYVATNGNNQAAGTLAAPLQTIQVAFNKASAGDTIVLREGTYREPVVLKYKSGKDGSPITLKNYQQEKPVISGLDVLKLAWAATSQRGIYVTPLDTSAVLQLFYNGKPMLEARWPHCSKDANGDWNFFAPELWASADTEGNAYGTLACAALAKTGWDVTGAQVLLNVDHQFFCWTRPVRAHAAGASAFTYDQDLGKSVNKRDESGILGKWNQRNKFYLFGMKQFLGAPGEWFYDAAAKKLYVCSLDGKNPAEGLLEIKTREWGFTADSSCNYLTIDGVGFFGTAFKFGESPNKRSSHIVLRNSSVLHSSWTEYLSLNNTLPEQKRSMVGADSVFPTIMADDSQVVNSTFAYGALSALLMNGLNNRIENNLIHDFDYSSSLVYPPLQVNHPGEGLMEKAGHDVIRYNTICRSGGIQARMAQPGNDFSMNDVYDSYLACYGGNKDTSAVYTHSPSCIGTRFHHNWVHHGFSGTPPLPWGGGMGIRGDDLTCGLTVDHNVVWDCGSVGIFIKNVMHPLPEQANRCVNNTVFNHSAYNPIKSAIIISKAAGKKPPTAEPKGPEAQIGECPNAWSIVANNLADSIYGQWNAQPLGKLKLFSNNDTAFKVSTDLVKKDWNDFRPVANAAAIIHQGVAVEGITGKASGHAPDIGAYEHAGSVYWIPGQRLEKASFPIVPNHATNVPVNRDVLMWRPAYEAASHRVVFSTSEVGLDETSATTVQKTFPGEENVFPLPKLKPGTTYFWRVDAVKADKSVVQGEVWTFTTKATP
jgi:Right handed beta helix region